MTTIRIAAFLILVACAKLPETGDVGPISNVAPEGNCTVILAMTKDVSGMMCPEGFVALGVTSLSPSRIRCAKVDVEC